VGKQPPSCKLAVRHHLALFLLLGVVLQFGLDHHWRTAAAGPLKRLLRQRKAGLALDQQL
jgi:hypothetical protein